MPEPIEIEIELGELDFNAEDRTVSGLVVPFGEAGRTSVGRLIVSKDTIELPRDPSIISANFDHDRHRNVARATEVSQQEAGIFAKFHIADTDDGDGLLADLAAGKKKGLSIELAPGSRIKEGGHLVSARMTGAAITDTPAFQSAAIYASANFVESEPIDASLHDERVALHTTPAPAEEAPKPKKTKKKETPMTDAIATEDEAVAVVPEAITASRPADKPKQWGTKREILGAMARRAHGQATQVDRDLLDKIRLSEQEIFASLDVIPFSGSGSPVPYDNSPQYLGELTELVYGQTAFADLAGQGDLLKPTLSGFHWNALPTPGTGASSWSSPYAGNAAGVPTSLITTTPFTASAHYFAGGIETPREWNLFGVDEALLGKYFDRQSQNFGIFLDEGVFTTVNAALTAVEADNPSGITIGAGWSALVDALFNVITQKGGLPTAAVIEPTLWKSMAKTSNIDAFAYLSAQLGFTDGELAGFRIRPDYSGQLATGNILAGNFKAGVSLYTLPGSPLRFQALNIAAGAAVDTAVMGAAAVVLEQAECFSLVEPYSA